MMSLSYQLAYDAIEEFVVEEQLDGPGGAWREKIPADDWGFSSEGWEAAATRIVTLFNNRLPNHQDIDVPPAAKRSSRSQPLISFQRYLAAKADELSTAPIIVALEA